MTSSFAFVPALALSTARNRSPLLCGGGTTFIARAQVRSVRRSQLGWFACAEKPESPVAASEPAPEAVAVPDEVEAIATPEEAVAVPEEAAEVAVPEEAAAMASAAAPAAEAENKPGDRRNKRRRKRREREVTLPLEKMEVGMELEGVVKSVTSYGAFIGEMGTPTDGLLHVSQLSSGYVENVTDIVQVGQKVKVRVTDINMEKSNFSLSMKPVGAEGDDDGAQRRPSRREQTRAKWDAFTYDDTVFRDAQVTSIADFGCFCKLLDAEGNPDNSVPTEGLVHISEVSTERVDKMTDAVNVDQVVKVRVVGIDKKRNRISLSMKEKSESRERNGRDNRGSRDSGFSEEIKKSNESQPKFKTSFELAFERAGLKVEA